MSFDIRLEDERGERVDEVSGPTDALQGLLPSPKDESFSCLRFIDPYGNTVFNSLQAEVLLAELTRIRPTTTTNLERELLDRIEELAERCRSEPHLYIKFYGD